MKKIKLTQGQYALVDDDDFEWLNQWKWYARWSKRTQSFYAIRREKALKKRRTVYMHRQILGLKHGDKHQGDHIHHKTLDNRRSQLRIVNSQQNNFNRRGVDGYYFHKDKGKFEAEIRIGQKKIYLGNYPTAKQARTAYLAAKKKYHVM